jgi:hypothetical protein
MWTSRWSRLLVALLICVAAVACGGGQASGGSPFEQSSADAPAPDSGGSAGSGSSGSGSYGGSAEPRSDGAAGAPGAPGSPGSPGAPGAPGNGGNNAGALASPLTIPDIQQVGAPISEAKPQIQLQFEELCEHREPCVNLVVRPADVDPDHCLFSRTDPPKGTEIQRGATVTLVCDPEDGAGGESTDTTEPTEQTSAPTETTAPTDTTQPTDTTGSTEAGQPGNS